MGEKFKQKQVLRVMPEEVRLLVEKEKAYFGKLSEIKMRKGRPCVLLVYDNTEMMISRGKKFIASHVTKEEIREALWNLLFLYAFEATWPGDL